MNDVGLDFDFELNPNLDTNPKLNPNNGVHARSIGLVQEAAALVWTARWGYTSSTVIAMLTNKQAPPRLVKARLLKKDAMRNPRAAAQAGLTLTPAGLRRAEILLQRVRQHTVFSQLAEQRGFGPLLLDRSAPRLQGGRMRSWTFDHDIKLQTLVASWTREYYSQLETFTRFQPVGLRTTAELERAIRRPGDRIVDFQLFAPHPDGFGKSRFHLEFENSRKRQDEVDRMLAQWSYLLANTAANVMVLCGDRMLFKAWQSDTTKLDVPAYVRTDQRKWRKTDRNLAIDLPRERFFVQRVNWDAVKQLIAHPPRRA